MKAVIKLAFFSLLALHATALPINNSSHKNTSSEAVPINIKSLTQEDANALVKRVYEINSTDINALSKAEKRQMRRELQSIHQQLNDPLAGGVYISAGALIVILVLLLILF